MATGWKAVYDLVDATRKELKADIGKIDERVDKLVEDKGVLSGRVTAVETESKNLSKRIGAWNIGNTVGVLIAGVLAYFGIKN